MANWEIVAVGDDPREWQGSKGGPNLSWRLGIKSADGSTQPPRGKAEYAGVEYVAKKDKPAPQPGQKIEGEVKIRPWKTKEGEDREDLKFEKPRGFGGGGGRGWQPRIDDDPVVYAGKQAAIAAQTSLERATEMVLACLRDTDKADPTVLAETVIEVATEYEEHIQERARAAGQRVREAKQK